MANDSVIIVSFRGEKMEIPFPDHDNDNDNCTYCSSAPLTVGMIRRWMTERTSVQNPKDIKLIYNGKIFKDDTVRLNTILRPKRKGKRVDEKNKSKTTYKIMATGISKDESEGMNRQLQEGISNAKRTVRDDLTEQGQRHMMQRKNLGHQLLKQSEAAYQRKQASSDSSVNYTYGFGRIETLSNLPEEDKAREILTTLANDPGIKACMAKHKWKVGSLAEMFPEGKVGESEICVMGLNKNKGQQILLRIRTDDLKGFRKMLSIREVLYHELAHNIYSKHNGDFFQLMRVIKKECLEMDWTQGNGTTASKHDSIEKDGFSGGVFRLGGDNGCENEYDLPPRELARRAALRRFEAGQGDQRRKCPENACCGVQHRQIDFEKSHCSDDDHTENMDES